MSQSGGGDVTTEQRRALFGLGDAEYGYDHYSWPDSHRFLVQVFGWDTAFALYSPGLVLCYTGNVALASSMHDSWHTKIVLTVLGNDGSDAAIDGSVTCSVAIALTNAHHFGEIIDAVVQGGSSSLVMEATAKDAAARPNRTMKNDTATYGNPLTD